MAIEYHDTQGDDGSNPLNGIHAIDVVNIDGNVYAIVGGDNNTLVVYSIDNDPASPTYGEMSDTPIDSVADGGTLNLSRIRGLESVEVDGTTFLIAAGEDDKGISTFSINSTGQLTHHDDFGDDGSTYLDGAKSVATAQVADGAGGTKSLVFVSGTEGGVSAFEIDNGGNLSRFV